MQKKQIGHPLQKCLWVTFFPFKDNIVFPFSLGTTHTLGAILLNLYGNLHLHGNGDVELNVKTQMCGLFAFECDYFMQLIPNSPFITSSFDIRNLSTGQDSKHTLIIDRSISNCRRYIYIYIWLKNYLYGVTHYPNNIHS